MKRELLIGYAIVVMGFAAMIVMMVGLSALAADQPMEKGIGPKIEGTMMTDQGTAKGTEPAIREIGKETEKPMRAPEGEELFGFGVQHLLVPDRADFERARESDMRSEVSF